jgi:hypothetical protein
MAAASDKKDRRPALSKRDTSSEGPSEVARWAASAECRLKSIVDAGWDALTKKAGIGVIIRDHCGQVVLSEWQFIPWYAS